MASLTPHIRHVPLSSRPLILNISKRRLQLGQALRKRKKEEKCVEKCTKQQLQAKADLLNMRHLQPSAKVLQGFKFQQAPPKVDIQLNLNQEENCRRMQECPQQHRKKK